DASHRTSVTNGSYFFFQAEDGIRDFHVTGVQTCALPIYAFEYAAQKGKKVHFIGLLSDGGVHSHINHLFGLLQTAKYYDCDKVYVHAFTDGRDVDPKSGVTHLQHLQQFMQDNEVGKLASVIGRYYAMDRDRRWQRVKKAYDLLVKGQGNPATNIID